MSKGSQLRACSLSAALILGLALPAVAQAPLLPAPIPTPSVSDPIVDPLVDLPGIPTVLPAASLRSALPSPFIYGAPDRFLPGRVWLKVSGFNHARLGQVGLDEGETRAFLERLDQIGRETGVHIAFLRRSAFGWAIVDISALQTPLIRPGEELTVSLTEALAAHEQVAGASPSSWFRKSFAPNDPGLGQMWHLDAIGARSAWDQSRGAASQRIGVVDTGTRRNHQDLAPKDQAGFDFVSFTEVSNDGDGRDAEYNDPGDAGGPCNEPEDSWHGSHVAGTIVAAANNGLGIPGVNHNARLVTGRALGQCGGADFDILEAMAWMAGFQIDEVPDIASADRVSVINLSLGGDTPCSQAQADFVSTIVNNGTQIVAAAGNSGNDIPVASPASCPGAIAVGAHGPGVGRPLAPYSNFSDRLDIIAPGGFQQNQFDEGVLSACGPQSDCYTFQQGTSMASPHVAGVVSLMQAVNPTISRDDIVSTLQDNGESCTGCGTKVAVRLDLALAAAAGLPPPPPPEGDYGVGPCDFNGECPVGQACLGTPTGTPECFLTCANAESCANETQCFPVDSGLNVCVKSGNRAEGEDCTDPFTECGPGLLCGEAGRCIARCDFSFECPHPDQTCSVVSADTGLALCTPFSDELPPIEPVAPPPPTPQPLPNGGECDSRRGHWDCPTRFGCGDVPEGETAGECIANAHGDTGTGGICNDDDDCEGGLCDKGVCTTPCDIGDGCRDGFACADDVIPGGICRAESCEASKGDICEDGWVCTFSSTSNYVCSVDGDDAFSLLFCSHAEVSDSAPAGLLGLALLALALRRRRRR